ncbi:uncharacterized protein LOC117173136 [Belonocnema kinseyi]|uniref:uncharacterized protein LOC117173136 n=1 Tax=Belonocnema kinseyi TaxID=2817044 RepID=UPI00143D80D6|nr:uncharacterized protein LOC117173136 [Belonocnema kinseyi]
MKIIGNILIHAFLGFLAFKNACGFNVVDDYTIGVKMSDNSTYRGAIETIFYSGVCQWMQPGEAATTRNYLAFIRLRTQLSNSEHFSSKLVPFYPRRGHEPWHDHPTFAELRLEHNEYYTASDFQLYIIGDLHLPPINRIYIKNPGGLIYSSPLNPPQHIIPHEN